MAIEAKKPSRKYTVGAQYIAFNTPDANGGWTSDFEETVLKLPTITTVSITDDADSYETYASGDVYDADVVIGKKEIQETNIAFPEELLARMRGDTVDEGVIAEGGISTRPFFAYGVVIIKKDGSKDLRWYPKCKLAENTDEAETSEAANKDQTDDITINAYGFDGNQTKVIRLLTNIEGYETVTENAFFATPILTVAAAKALKPQQAGG